MRSDDARFLDMFMAARRIIEFTADTDATAFAVSKVVQSAVLREFQVLGEAARLISDSTKATHPEIPWSKIAGMRNRVVHEYFDVDLDIVWATVTSDIPSLVALLRPLVPPPQD